MTSSNKLIQPTAKTRRLITVVGPMERIPISPAVSTPKSTTNFKQILE